MKENKGKRRRIKEKGRKRKTFEGKVREKGRWKEREQEDDTKK